MTVSPHPPNAGLPSIAPLRDRQTRQTTPSIPRRSQQPPTQRGIARRRWLLMWSKRLLPVAAVLLLASIALWPQIVQQLSPSKLPRRAGQVVEAGQLRDARYRGLDVHGRPYAITADIAAQDGPERVNLTQPKGDVVTESGTWLIVQAEQGVYMQHSGQLDLSGNATLYRDDGITMRSDTVALDVKSGAASSDDKTHAEGPFGTLDSQGFTLLDKGAVVQFRGPSRLVLNGSQK